MPSRPSRALAFSSLSTVAALLAAVGFAIAARADEGEWSMGADMPTARSELAVTQFEGRIYAAGGIAQWGTSDAFEVYDPAFNTWRRLAPLPKAVHHPAMAAADGRIYLSGGYRDLFFKRMSNDTWAYDPGKDRWSAVASMPAPRAAHKLSALGGKIYVAGGRGPDASALWVYDPVAKQWDTTRAPLPTPREHLAAAALDSKLYVIGGRGRDHVNMSVVEAYDPATNTWTRVADLPAARGGHAATALNGRIDVTGGEEIASGKVFAEHWVYEPEQDRWRAAPPMPTARHGADSATTGKSWYVVGGGTAAGYRTMFTLTGALEIYSRK